MNYPERMYLRACLDKGESVEYIRGDIVEDIRKQCREGAGEIGRLRDIITGALAHSCGPYTTRDLLRRMVVILNTATTRKSVEAAKGGEHDRRGIGPACR